MKDQDNRRVRVGHILEDELGQRGLVVPTEHTPVIVWDGIRRNSRGRLPYTGSFRDRCSSYGKIIGTAKSNPELLEGDLERYLKGSEH